MREGLRGYRLAKVLEIWSVVVEYYTVLRREAVERIFGSLVV